MTFSGNMKTAFYARILRKIDAVRKPGITLIGLSFCAADPIIRFAWIRAIFPIQP
jgi:hypothetical protein